MLLKMSGNNDEKKVGKIYAERVILTLSWNGMNKR